MHKPYIINIRCINKLPIAYLARKMGELTAHLIPGMIERQDSQWIWNEMSPFQYHLSCF